MTLFPLVTSSITIIIFLIELIYKTFIFSFDYFSFVKFPPFLIEARNKIPRLNVFFLYKLIITAATTTTKLHRLMMFSNCEMINWVKL